MRSAFFGLAVLVSLSSAAWAAPIGVPNKNPAVTLTIPDTWEVKDIDDGIQTIPPDKAVYLYVNYGSRSDLDTTLKANREWMRKNKIVVNTPKESTMDFSGTPGRVLRYDTKGKGGGKTIIDFIILEASRDRYVILTLWGSMEEREGNEAELAAIMSSVKIPSDGGSFWSGTGPAKLPPAASETPQSEAAKAPAAAPPANPLVQAAENKTAASKMAASKMAETKVAETKPAQPYTVKKALFVTRAATSFGDIAARSSNAFAPGELLRSYIELAGQATQPAGDAEVRFGVVIDMEVRTPEGKILGGQRGMLDRDFTIGRDETNPRFYVNSDATLTGLDPGTYLLVYVLHDKLSGRVVEVPQPFTIVPAAVETVASPPAAPASPPAPVTVSVDGWDVSLRPDKDSACIIRYDIKKPRDDGQKLHVSVAFVAIPKSENRLTALELGSTGWSWADNQTIKANLDLGYFRKMSGMTWVAVANNAAIVTSRTESEITDIVTANRKLGFVPEGKEPLYFDIGDPAKALDAIKPCRDLQK